MTIVAPGGGTNFPIFVNLTTTAATDIYVVGTGWQATIESLLVSCGDTITVVSVWVTDGTTLWYLRNGKSFAINTDDHIKEHPLVLRAGWKICASASVAGKISVTGSILLQQANKSPQ